MLPFLPRKVARSLRNKPDSRSKDVPSSFPGITAPQTNEEAHDPSRQASTSRISAHDVGSELNNNAKHKTIEKKEEQETDLTTLVSLSLSDYATWSDPDLARALAGGEQCTCTYCFIYN